MNWLQIDYELIKCMEHSLNRADIVSIDINFRLELFLFSWIQINGNFLFRTEVGVTNDIPSVSSGSLLKVLFKELTKPLSISAA